MRTTVTIDDVLDEEALAVAARGMDRGDLFREAIKTLVREQSAKRLSALGSTAPDMADVPRRRAGAAP
ncbi:type II toxin-antitoxin system VapB family antitoxin [Variovorax guangxiensis]|uniref:Type II toxin-antitoxin system VapB family antitoxin n=1 Tax=Variovorax guangxiensis TaxID=1775474 RepID=A0A502E263_9BURK|nr:type II toxin-antitoxin system VapB family antitoxin [Variovorax guangxiensis]TPG26929.1 type II toxin-antitoxin system VapB family antitoxin [Variovorax ginsengisoli]TPG30656.1 type II toxin-antitoxin system VapB family antitoxin [Variovorax guangxiensis]